MRQDSNADDDSLIQNLLKSNESPTEEQKVSIRAKLQKLEEDFLNKAGRAFSNDLVEQHEHIPRRAKSCHEAILSHRALLSCVRCVPEEVWQRVFFFEVVNEAGGWHNTDGLRRICAVSRRWRSAAIKHCYLWTRIPLISLTDPDTKKLPNVIEDLELYLSRSGALPISVSCYISSDVCVAQRDHVEKILQLLTGQSHRWQDLWMRFPLPEMKMLSPIQDNLPILTELDFEVRATDSESPEEHPREIKIPYFSNAPMLRDVKIFSRNAIPLMDIEEEPVFRIELPWSQLENFEDEARCTTSYRDVIEAQPVNLKTLDMTASLIPELPSTPCTLPKLEKLHLKVGNNGNLVASHLDLLTLPALTNLVIRGRFLSSDPLYTKVLALLRRSGCSLKHLDLDPVNADPSVFSSIFLLSPTIETLDITNPDTSTLHNLILDTSSPSPVLPRLKSVTIRNSEMDAQIVVFDAPTLMRMIKSRTEELAEGSFDKDLFQPLEDVSFVFDSDETFHLHTVLFEMEDTAAYEGARNRDTSLGELASRSRRILRDELTCYWHPRMSYLNLKLHLRYNKLLSKLEQVDLAKHNSQVLMRRGLPYLLKYLGDMPKGTVPGDRVFRFRRRARKLNEKWKPFILRDIRSTPYRWSYSGESIVTLRYLKPGDDVEEDEYELWREVLGQRYRDSNATRLFTPWLW